MSDSKKNRSCPIPEKKLRRFGLDSGSWQLLILAPAVDYIMLDRCIRESEKRFLDYHPLRSKSMIQAEEFVPSLIGNPDMRAKAMTLLAESLRYPLDGQRENLIDDIEENLFEAAMSDPFRVRGGIEDGKYLSEEAIREIEFVLKKIGLKRRRSVFGENSPKPDIQEFIYPDFSDQKKEVRPQEQENESPVLRESVAKKMRENIEGQDDWGVDCLNILKMFLAKTRAEYEGSSDLEKLLEDCDTEAAPYFHKGVGVLPGPSEHEKLFFVGDLHGDAETFDRVLEVTGYLSDPQVKLIFLGDYVDRGRGSLQILIRIMELKLENWERIQMLRGNHEALREVTKDNGETAWASGTRNQEFVEDVQNYLADFGEAWSLFNDIFQSLLHFLVIGGKVAVCHGGVIPRFTDEDPLKGKIGEGLQADLAVENWLDLVKPKVEYYLRWARCNWKPQVAYIWNGESLSNKCFDYGDVEAFLNRLGLESLVRGHDHPGEGFFVVAECPRMVTICTSTTVNIGSYECTPKIAVMDGGGEIKAVAL